MTTTPDSVLPLLYARWARELLGADPPREARATCLDCAMAPPADGAANFGLNYFQPTLKCCTYVPVLPNFLAGAALADGRDEMAEGRQSLMNRIAAGNGVTPLGIDRSPAEDAIYQVLSPTAFGSDTSLRCPHMTSDNLCGIWRHRNAVCATWFCKHERGAVGEAFWDHLREWLRGIESELASWCVLRAGWPGEALANLFRAAPSHSPEVRAFPAPPGGSWGAWEGRAEDFYQWCAAQVAALPWVEVARICGPTVAARSESVRHAFARLQSTALPSALMAGPLTILGRRPGTAIVLTYRGTDPLELTSDVQRVIERFDGRPISEVVSHLRSEDGLDIELDLVRRLHDFGVLRDATHGNP